MGDPYLVELPIPLKPGVTVYLRYPHDGLTRDEANRICLVVQALIIEQPKEDTHPAHGVGDWKGQNWCDNCDGKPKEDSDAI